MAARWTVSRSAEGWALYDRDRPERQGGPFPTRAKARAAKSWLDAHPDAVSTLADAIADGLIPPDPPAEFLRKVAGFIKYGKADA